MKGKLIPVHLGNAWAMVDRQLMPWEDTEANRAGIKVYYSNEIFFGVQDGNGNQLLAGVDSPGEEWEQIAWQLYAMLKGWV